MNQGLQFVIQLNQSAPFQHYLIYQFNDQMVLGDRFIHLSDLIGELSQQEKDGYCRPQLTPNHLLYLPLSAGEPLSFIQQLSQEKELFAFPSEVATAIVLQISKAIAYLHAMGFVHGPINSQHIYIGLDGKIKLYGWVEGNLADQIHTTAQDVMSIGLLWESLLTGYRRKDPQNQVAHPKIDEISRSYQELIAKTLSPNPQERYSHAGAFLNALKQCLEQNPCFDEAQLGRWLSRMNAQRAQQWKSLQTAQTLEEASPISQTLLEKTNQSFSFVLPYFEELKSTKITPIAHTIPNPNPTLPIPQFTQTNPLPQPIQNLPIPIPVPSTTKAKPQHKNPQLHIALVWNDTVYYSNVFTPQTKLHLGDSLLPLTPEMKRVGGDLLLGEYDGEQVKLRLNPQFKGYYLNQNKEKKALDAFQSLKINEAIFLNFGESALFIKLEEKIIHTQSSIPQRIIAGIADLEQQLLIAFVFALCLHLVFIIYGYASIDYDREMQDTDISDRFVQILIDTPEPPKVEPVKEAEKKREEEEEVKETKKPERVEVPSTNIKDTIKQRTKSKFGEGKSAANALADFLEGKSDASEEKLSLNDASSALGAGLNSASAGLGAALGAVGGDISLGGGGGGGALDGLLGAGVGKSGGVGKVKGGSGGGGGIKGQVKAMNSQVKATGGSLSKEEIAKVIQQYSSKISNCYEKSLLKNPDISGRLQVEWTIQENGSVTDVKQAYSGITQPELSACILALFNQMKFPKPQGGSVKVKYPFIFSQR